MEREDTTELRDQLTEAWRGLTKRLIEAQHPAAAVVETMFNAASEHFAEIHGSTAAANYLHLLADQLLQSEKNKVDTLLGG